MPERMRPTAPSSMSLRASRPPAPRNVSGAQPTIRLARFRLRHRPCGRARRRPPAASRRRRACRRKAPRATRRRAPPGSVRLTTMSMSSRASSASTGIASHAEPLALRLRHLRLHVGAGAHLHARHVRQVGQVDRRDIAAADDSDADVVQVCLPTRPKWSANERRAKRSKSFGLSCSITRYLTPGALIAGISFFQSSTPWPTSACPSSSAFSPFGARSLTCSAVDPVLVFLDPGGGVFARPFDPADVGLPVQARRGGEDVVERIAAVGELGELEAVVVPGEVDAVRGELLLVAGELLAELRPAGRVAASAPPSGRPAR